ncbi:MAG TPA: FAD-linked oxidase C-terminal domain-containing protein [Phycisphaerae bacterium]|jgi:glycolate oxidase|nr:FAD-linked oxidase C-terminal domain-containing protein [Phycisphaerae bacterium]
MPFLSALRSALAPGAVIDDPTALIVYECDGFTIPRATPLAVAFPASTDEVVAVVNLCRGHKIAVLPRGSGTGLTGGIVPVTPSIQLSTARMNKILEVDIPNRCALVEAGVTNSALSDAVKNSPYHYAPDPSSQRASTIGGNVATNAGGLHTLKYGVTVNHLLGMEFVSADGQVHCVGSPRGHDLGPDFAGLLCGSEGTLGIITKVWCRLSPRPAAFRTALAVFHRTQDACQAVADIIAAGITPAALEMMDGPMIQIVEDAFHLGFPTGAQALLVIEVDGPAIADGGALDEDLACIDALCQQNRAACVESSRDPQRRAALWSARKRAFGAIGRISPSYCTQDACVPRSKLPEVISQIAHICQRHGLRATNVFHAGDGNVHPVLMYDEGDGDSVQRALAASADILRLCISIGGVLTGEHGVGIEKLPFMSDMYSPADLAAMHAVRTALVPTDLMNPYKVLPRENAPVNLLHPQRKVPQ